MLEEGGRIESDGYVIEADPESDLVIETLDDG